MEECRRCDGIRNGLGKWKGIMEDDGVGWTCWRSIGDWYLTQRLVESSWRSSRVARRIRSARQKMIQYSN